MNRSRLVLAGLIAGLVLTVAALAYVNHSRLALNDPDGEKLVVMECGEVAATVDKALITGMGGEEFSAVLRGGGRPPEEHGYVGIPAKEFLERQKPEILEGKKQVLFKGTDGYVAAFTVEEIKDEGNVYVVYKEDGKELKSRRMGGSGPLKIVARKDDFGQRWCKFLCEVDVQ